MPGDGSDSKVGKRFFSSSQEESCRNYWDISLKTEMASDIDKTRLPEAAGWAEATSGPEGIREPKKEEEISTLPKYS